MCNVKWNLHLYAMVAKVKGHSTAMTNTIYLKKISSMKVFRLNLLTFYIYGLDIPLLIQDIIELSSLKITNQFQHIFEWKHTFISFHSKNSVLKEINHKNRK